MTVRDEPPPIAHFIMRLLKKKLAVGKTPIARSRLTVKNFDFGLGRDAERRGRGSEPHRLVKPRLELPDWPVHNDDCRALIHADDTAQSIFKAKDIASPQPKRMFNRPPDDADKLRLIRINAVSPAALPACAHLFGAALESRFLLVCMCFHGLTLKTRGHENLGVRRVLVWVGVGLQSRVGGSGGLIFESPLAGAAGHSSRHPNPDRACRAGSS